MEMFHFLKNFTYLFLEGKGGRKRERNISPDGDQSCNPDMCPDWESNQQPFTLQDNAQSTEPHQSGPGSFYFNFVSTL